MTESPYVNAPINQLNEYRTGRISQRWNSFNEKQLHQLLIKFSKFLQSEIVRCHLLKANVIGDSYLRNLSKLYEALNLKPVTASDTKAPK